MCPNVINIIGHSGSGKTTLVRKLAEHFHCEELGFSYAGRELASEEAHSCRFNEINEYIYSCITAAVNRSSMVIVDGLASIDVVQTLENQGYSILTIYLETSYDERINRISSREFCSTEDALAIEKAKAKGKGAAGLNYVISRADFTFDATQSMDSLVDSVVSCINGFMRN